MQSPVVYFEVRPSTYQEVAATLKEIYIDTYKQSEKQSIQIPSVEFTQNIDLTNTKALTFEFPIDQSKNSYYSAFGKDILTHENMSTSEYRTVRIMDDSRIVSFIDNSANIFYSNLPFSSDRMYIWKLDYNLGSGEYPFFGLEDDFRLAMYDQISMWQGYPDIEGFKTFQSPEFFVKKDDVADSLHRLQSQQGYTVISPNTGLNDMKDKYFKIAQSTENEGLLILDEMNIVNVPNYWGNLALVPTQGAVSTYLMPNAVTYKRLLPSLMRVELKSERPGPMLFKFNEGYDTQWGVYESISGLIFGRAKSPSVRCDTYANCFEINMQKGSKTLYVFFWPERLAIAGWVATIAGAIVVMFLWRRKQLHA